MTPLCVVFATFFPLIQWQIDWLCSFAVVLLQIELSFLGRFLPLISRCYLTFGADSGWITYIFEWWFCQAVFSVNILLDGKMGLVFSWSQNWLHGKLIFLWNSFINRQVSHRREDPCVNCKHGSLHILVNGFVLNL